MVSVLSAEDQMYMEHAYQLAEEALEANEVPVGCVFVHNGQEIGRGRNEVNCSKDPTTHAEMVAIRRMQAEIPNISEILSELVLYVTLEPCIMCACGLYELGIMKVVYGACNERFGGIKSVGNWEKYRIKSKIFEVVDMVQADRSIALLKAFYDKQNPFAPEEKRKTKKKKTISNEESTSLQIIPIL